MKELKRLKILVDDIKKAVKNSHTSILSEEVLKCCMTSAHYHSLKSKMRSEGDILTYEWLLGIQVQESRKSFHSHVGWDSLNSSSFLSDEDISFINDSEEEADIEHIEAQRAINPDEFAGASYDIPLNKDELDSTIILEDSWRFVGGKQGLKYHVHACLSCTSAVPIKIAKQIKDVWALSYDLKWSLYKFWLEGYIEKQNEKITKLHQQIREQYKELHEVRSQEDSNVCRLALVVGMTTTGAAKYRHILQHLNPRIVIVEEAAEILESHIVTSLARDTQHLILIGDHQQLKPNPTVHLLATKYGMNISLFERMIGNGLDCHKLEIQHRMRPEIASLLVPHIYTKLYNHESVKAFENIKGVAKNVFFVNHSYFELQENDSKSKVNLHEATFILKFCKYLIMQGYKPSQITVLTTYSGQLFQFKKSPLKKDLEGVRFTVVDNYQGEENDIILISFVRSNEEGQIGFLKISNRVCVALSRAKKGLYCIGNFGLLAEKSNLWKNVVGALTVNASIGPSLPLMCQNHPDFIRAVTNESDFDLVPEGGCTKQCEFRLSCGHLCSLKCHPYNSEHVDISCPKPCIKKCSEGHLCAMKCYENCPPCLVLVSKTIEKCGHTIQVPCHLLTETTPCTEPCENLLICGHECPRKCGEPCTLLICMAKIMIQSFVCGHELSIECSKSKDVEFLMMRCKKPCGVELPCGHICCGSCGSCFQGRLHVSCKEFCNRKLVCGHECKSICYRNCPPCKQRCENSCIHRKCAKKCGEPCVKCTKSCKWSCPHKKCTRLCWEPCDRTLCNEPCPKVLKCKHPCIGICGELCPKECRICDKEKLTKLCFGQEIEADAMFICLKDCRHIFEVNWFKQWVNQESRRKNEIRFKTCPTCKTVVRRPLYLERNIESWCNNIEKIKNVVSENKDYNDLQEGLRQRIKEKNVDFFCGHYIASSSCTFPAAWMRIKESLESVQRRDFQDLIAMENMMNIMKMWTSYSSSQRSGLFRNFSSLTVHLKLAEKVEKYLKVNEKMVVSFITKRYLIASEQQLKDLTWEVHRLKLINELDKSMIEVKSKDIDRVYKLMDNLLTYSPFREAELTKFISELQNLSGLPGSLLNISKLQKQPILKIISFSEGHWFLCEKGHAYSAVNCKDPSQERNCLECNRKIIYIKPILPKPYQPPPKRRKWDKKDQPPPKRRKWDKRDNFKRQKVL